MHLLSVNATPNSDDLVLTLYGNGLVKVDYRVEANGMDIQIEVNLFGSDIQNLVVRDEAGDPLDYQLTNSIVIVDSIGATEIYFTYYTESLVKSEAGLTYVTVDSPSPVGILLPEGADFFDMSHLPTEISEFNGVSYLQFEPGDIFVYYLIGLPKLQQESLNSLEKAESYILSRQSEGYHLDGATDLLTQATLKYNQREFYQSKTLADDALKVAVITVDSAQDALKSINSVKTSLNTVQDGDSESISQASEQLSVAQGHYDQGDYVRASLTAMEISKIDLVASPTGILTVFNQSVPLILILGLCSIIYLLENTGKTQFKEFLGGGLSE
jgi:hypothetical protein